MNIEKIKVPANWLCVRYDNSNEHFDLAGEKMKLDISFEPEKHAQTKGTVIKVCDHLVFNQKNSNSHPFDVDIEIKEGDTVIFHFLTIIQAKKDGKIFIEDGQMYVFMPYERVFCALRGEEVIPVNGYIFVRPDDEPLPKTNLVLPEISKKLSKNTGTVVHAGGKCRGYYGIHMAHLGEDPEVNIGDKVIFSELDAIPLEYEFHAILDRDLYRMQRKDVLMASTNV